MAFGSVGVLLYYQEETTPPPSPLQLEPWIGFVDIVGHYNVKPGATAGSIIVTPGIPNTDLIDRVHAKQKKIVLVMGGGGMSGGITTDAAFRLICGAGSDPAKRAQFVDLVLDEVVKGYDGIDLDWEFPASADDEAGLKNLIALFDADDRMDGKTISIGVQINDYSASWIPTDAMTQGRLAWYGVQTYSHHSPSLPQSADPHAGHPGAIHSTSADNVKHDPHGPPNLHTPSFDTALSYWLGRNVPRSKIRLGIGFSGADYLTVDQLYDDIPDSGDPGRLRDYKDLADLVDDAGWTEHRDEAAIAKYFIATNRIVTMPTDFSVQASLRFAAAEHLPGMIVWAAGKDWIGGEPKLVKAMSQTVGVTRSLWLGARDFIASGAGASLAIVGTTGSDNRPVVWVFPASSGVITAAVTLPEGWLSAHPIVPILHWSRAAGTNGIVGWRIRTALVDVGDQVDEAPTTLLDPGPTWGPVTAETLALTPMGGVQPSAARTLRIAIERIPKSLAGVPSFAGDSWVLGLELQYVASS